MSLRLHETTVACFTCGSNIWQVTIYMYDLSSKMTVPREDDPVCPKCQRIRYITLLKQAKKIEPLITVNEGVAVKGGKAYERVERPKDATPLDVEKIVEKAKDDALENGVVSSLVTDEDIEKFEANPTKPFTIDDWINQYIPQDEQKKKVWFT